MISISRSVGNNAANIKADVLVVQKLLNKSIGWLSPYLPLIEDGDCGPVTVGLIIEFQKRLVGVKKPDGRIDPNKNSIKVLADYANKKHQQNENEKFSFNYLLLSVQSYLRSFNAQVSKAKNDRAKNSSKSQSLTNIDYSRAAALLGVDVAAIKAVAAVESAGGGFLANGKPKILFEGHWFSALTKGQFDKSNPTLSYAKWTKKYYQGGEKEYSRFNSAVKLDRTAALKSTSWGRFQIMGFNHAKAGYANVEDFVKAMQRSEGDQLMAFVNFLKSTKLDVPLKIKDWAKFAERYNGPKYSENKYDIRLKQAFESFSVK